MLSRRTSALPADLAEPANIETYCQALAGHGLFADLEPAQISQLVAGSQLLRFGPGEAVVVEGSEGESMHHLLCGRIEVVKQVGEEQCNVLIGTMKTLFLAVRGG